VTTRVLGPLVPSFFFLSHSILEGLKSRSPMTSRWMVRLTRMRFVKLAIVIFASVAPIWPQAGQLKTADAVLDRATSMPWAVQML
jgi:hypothetical protein